MGEALFSRECRAALRNLPGSSYFSRPRKELYRDISELYQDISELYRDISASDPLREGHGWTAEEIRPHWNWAPGSSFLNNSEFSLTWRLALLGLNYRAGLGRHARLCSLRLWFKRNGWVHFILLRASSHVLDHVGEWTARIEPKHLLLHDVGYVLDNVLPPFQGEKRVVFLVIQAASRMVIWTTRKKGLYDDENFSHRDLVLYFRHQLRVKIRCDRKRLDRMTFDKRWVNAASLVVRKGAMLESSFPPLPVHGVYGTGSSGPFPE